jgi:hypothetical protein
VALREPRTTIVSFVVHRAGDRWLCASAHNTDVTAAASAALMDKAVPSPHQGPALDGMSPSSA